MTTDALIQALAANASPVGRHTVERRLALGIAAGGAATLALVAVWLGFRGDLGPATGGFSFWMKAAYTLWLGAGALALLARLARPDPGRLRLWPVVAAPLALAVVAASEMAAAPAPERMALWLGATWLKCPWAVLALAGPIFLGLLWAFRRLAPTRLPAAGAAAGFASGAWGAALYCLHCPETSAAFVLTWYSLGIALATGVGALLGPRLLRW